MKSIYQLLLEAQEKIKWETIEGLAAVLATHYHWSEEKRASLDEIKSLCSRLCFEVEMQQQRNEQRGNGKKEIHISSGCWTISVFYFSDSPFVSISFGLHATEQ